MILVLKISLCLLVCFILGCSSNPPAVQHLTVGMELDTAREIIASAGGQNVEMAIVNQDGDIHPNVYDLPNGKVVILNGLKTLDSITIIENPDQPKSKREFREVTELTLPQSN